MIEETSAGIILFRREKAQILFLLLHYPSGHWDFVKGKIENNESARETSVREMREETGITKISFIENFEEWIQYNFQYEKETVNKKVVFFLAETNTENVVISHEHVGYTWLNYNDAMEKITFDNAKTILTRAHSVISNTLKL